MLEEDYGWFFRNALLVNVLSVEGNQEFTVRFHEQRAAQTLSPSVKIRNWRIRLLCVSFFLLFSQSLPLSAEEQTAAQQLKLQTGNEMEFSVEEVIRGWNVSIPETFNPLCSSAECRRDWFGDLIPLKSVEFFRNWIKLLNKPFHFLFCTD